VCSEAGVYRREVVCSDGSEQTLVVLRFICRSRGPRRPAERTFSVLPADVIPRRRWSVGWLLKVALLCVESLEAGLDELSAAGMTVDARQAMRMLTVLGIGCERLHQHPVAGLEVEPVGGRRQQAGAVARACEVWQASGRGPPAAVVMAWFGQMRSPLLDVRLS
jgi:hypothetical protein